MSERPPAKARSEQTESSQKRRNPVAYTREDALADALERFRLPLLFTLILALIGGSRFEATRPLEAFFLALAVPSAALIAGALPFKDSGSGVRFAGFAVAASLLLLSLGSIGGTLFAGYAPAQGALWAALLALCGLAVLVEAVAARSGLKTRFAACAGIAAALAVYLPGHFDPREALGTVLAGVLVSVFLGGGAGLLLGAIATWLTRRA
jgi:hypothetical protein